ncbi:hypothetical protein [Hamadaea tsunoensis]|uniref:hypothetical protein n=1 Tax=Hamadaea tsunoensis TaxID=53368 RepID=UPI00040E25B3|nr:hypothetical protein [Hamadaea tsunoensis]
MALEWSLFRGTTAIEDGLITAAELTTPAWRRLRRDVYVDARVELDHGLACHAVALSLPEDICFSGRSAAYLIGIGFAAGFADAVTVVRPPGHRLAARPGVEVSVADLSTDDIWEIRGLPVTSPARTAWDVGARFPARQAVPLIDALLARHFVVPAELDAYARANLRRRGCRRAQHAFGLADAGARTPEESLLRIAVIEAGLPRPTTQYAIDVPGGAAYHADLGWPRYRVALDYQGHPGPPRDPYRWDNETSRLVGRAGWQVIAVRQLPEDLPAALRETRAALHGRGWRGGTSDDGVSAR